jgi:hypothetical protein
MIQRLNRGEITEARIHQDLSTAIDDQIGSADAAGAADGTTGNGTDEPEEAFPLFLVPLYNLDDPQNDICHPLFTFRPIFPVARVISPLDTNGEHSY